MFQTLISQIQLISMPSVCEMTRSLSVEIAIFAVTLAFAFAFRAGPFQKAFIDCSSQKIGKPKAAKSMRKDTFVKDNDSALQRSERQKYVQTVLPQASSCHALDSILRAQGAEAIRLYEDMRTDGQLDSAIVATPNKQRHLELFTHLIHCAGRVGNLALVVTIVDDMIKMGVQRSLSFYESAMKMLASKKCYKEAMCIYERLEADSFVPSAVTLSCLISFAVELGDFDQAICFFDRLADVSTPSIRACMCILRVHSKRQDWERSLAVIRDMQRRGALIDCLVLNIVLATGVAACKLDDTKRLLDEFASIADVVSYNTVMKGLAQHKDYECALAHLDEMCDRGVKPNAITLNTVMDAAVRNSRVVEAWSMLARMHDLGLQPDKFTCTTLMKCLQSGASREQLHIILDLLKNVTSQWDPSTLYRGVIDAVVELDDHALTTRVVALIREKRVALPPADSQRLLHLISRESHTKVCRPSSPPWRCPVEQRRPVSVC